MDETEFNDQVDDLFITFEDQLDESGLDLDIDSTGSLLSIELPNGSSVVLSRQAATREVWVAAKSGGFHCRWSGDDWHCNRTGEALSELLNRVFSEQTDNQIEIF